MPSHLAHVLVTALVAYVPLAANYVLATVIAPIGKILPALVVLAAWRLRRRNRR